MKKYLISCIASVLSLSALSVQACCAVPDSISARASFTKEAESTEEASAVDSASAKKSSIKNHASASETSIKNHASASEPSIEDSASLKEPSVEESTSEMESSVKDSASAKESSTRKSSSAKESSTRKSSSAKESSIKDSGSSEISLLGIPVSSSPIETAHAIMEQVKEAALRVEAEQLQQEKQIAQLESVMNAQRNAMNAVMNASSDNNSRNAVAEEMAALDPALADAILSDPALADAFPANTAQTDLSQTNAAQPGVLQTDHTAQASAAGMNSAQANTAGTNSAQASGTGTNSAQTSGTGMNSTLADTAETETELPEETETEFHPIQIGASLPNTGGPLPDPHETETESDTSPEAGSEEASNSSDESAEDSPEAADHSPETPEGSQEAAENSPETPESSQEAAENSPETTDGSQEAADSSGQPQETSESEAGSDNVPDFIASSRHGVFSMPQLDDLTGINEARINLFDYVMLREYPLSRLPKDLHTLNRQLQEQVGGYDGTWSIYVRNLSTGQDLMVNDTPMRSASVMKLFIMGTVYEAFDRGDLPRNEDTVYLLRTMIINSSNESSNRLLTLLGDGDIAAGVARVNEFIRLRGFSEGTIEYNGFEDPAASLHPDHPNQITAKDVGLLLSRVYSRSFISRKVCNEIEQMMLDQATRYKIPRGLPEGEGAQCGNKSGETDTIANDAAVVYGPTTDYILVVLSNDWSNEDTANAQIAEISKTVYQFFEH